MFPARDDPGFGEPPALALAGGAKHPGCPADHGFGEDDFRHAKRQTGVWEMLNVFAMLFSMIHYCPTHSKWRKTRAQACVRRLPFLLSALSHGLPVPSSYIEKY